MATLTTDTPVGVTMTPELAAVSARLAPAIATYDRASAARIAHPVSPPAAASEAEAVAWYRVRSRLEQEANAAYVELRDAERAFVAAWDRAVEANSARREMAVIDDADYPGADVVTWGGPLPRVRASQRPAGWRDPSDVAPEIRDAYDPLADDLRGRD